MSAPTRIWFDAHQQTCPVPELTFDRFCERASDLELPDEQRSLDVYVALACQDEFPQGPKHLLAQYQGTIESALRGLRLRREQSEEVRSIFLENLFVGEAGTPAIQRYSGRGSLAGWLRVTVSRSAHRLLRKREMLLLGESEPEAACMGIWHDPERDALLAECKDAFRVAMRDAMDDLSPDEKAALDTHYRDAVSIDGLAARWKVHRATAARRIARLRCRLREDVLARLETRMGITASSALRLVRAAQSRLEASLRAEEDPPGTSF